MVAILRAPLCPAGHLPLKGGDRMSRRLSPTTKVARNELSQKQPLVSTLREEIMAVIAKHVQIDQDYLQVSMERGETMSTLEIDIQIPNKSAVPMAMAG